MIKYLLVPVMCFYSLLTLAESENKVNKSKEKLKDPAQFERIIKEYKKHVSNIPPEIREEIVEFRKKIVKLNKQKRKLFNQLSQASQDYLKKEQEYKKKLPMQRKQLIDIEENKAKNMNSK